MYLLCLLSCPFYNIFKSLLCLILITIVWRAYRIIYARKNLRPVRANEIVLVTGCSSGIGLAVSKHFYDLGYTVIATYRDKDHSSFLKLDSLAKRSSEDKSRQNKFILHKLDVRNDDSIKQIHAFVVDLLAENSHNKLYALINNAGIGSLQAFAWLKREHLRRMIETNLIGSMLMARQFLPHLIKSNGRLINVSSGLGYIPGPNYVTYGVTKTGLMYFTRALNMEMAQLGHKVKTICIAPANFIKQTHICFGNLEQVESSWAQMDESERKLFKNEYDTNCKLAKSLDIIAKDHHEAQKIAEANQSRSSNNNQSPLDPLWRFINSFRGINKVLTIEESGLLECFEDSLRLENPPEHIFAGDNFYNLVTGSLFLSLPISCSNWLGKMVAPSLYK